ncbi:MAG: asparaginase domain-containing protein [Planctomycetota bacterium]
MSQRLQIFSCGGTIDKVYFDDLSEFHVGAPQVVPLLEEAKYDVPYDFTPILSKDSLELTDEDRQLIRDQVAASSATKIVITHGTDTMVETGQALLGIEDKTIVLTGSLQPARFKSTDAAFNIGCAVTAVQLLSPGVYIGINGRTFSAANCRKNREAQRFETLDGS